MGTEKRGFASMDRMRQRQLASLGGKAAHEKKTAHEWTSEEAKLAGSKGGRKAAENKRKREEEARRDEEFDRLSREAGGSEYLDPNCP